MGRHYAPEPPPEPKRGLDRLPGWLREPGPLALLAVGVLIAACGVWAVVDMSRDIGSSGLAGPPASAPFVPPASPTGAEPTRGIGSPDSGAINATAGPPTTPPPRPTTTRPPTTGRAPAVAVTAAYDSTSSWPGGFTGSVEVTNSTGSPARWEVVLTYPTAVTATQVWSNTSTQPTVTPQRASRSSRTWRITGATTIAAGDSVTLGFQFDTTAGGAVLPTSCTVNGRACR